MQMIHQKTNGLITIVSFLFQLSATDNYDLSQLVEYIEYGNYIFNTTINFAINNKFSVYKSQFEGKI
jgi:hypothetical protein